MNGKQLRNSILQWAISGRLVPQDPNDEPAIELLKRINPNFTPQPTDSPLPPGWTACKMGELVNIISGVSYAKGDVTTKGIRILRGGNIQDGAILTYDDDVFLGEQYANSTNSVYKGDIVMVASTGSFIALGKTGYCLEDMENTQIGAFLRIIRAKDKALASFLNLFFLSDAFRKHIRNKAKGTNINNIKGSYITDYVFPLPPLAEQERIVNEVERWFACIEQMERSREALGKAARQTKRTLLSLAIAGRLVPQDPNDEPAIALLRRINPKFTPLPTDAPLPPGWTACTLEDIVEIKDNLRQPINSAERNKRVAGKKDSELYPYYGATGQVGYIDNYLMDGKYLLLGEDGAPFLDKMATKAYIVEGKCWVNNHAHVLLPHCNTEYMCLYLNQFAYYGYVTGSTRLKLTQASMKKMPVLVPPLAEQERIVGKVEELFAVLDALQ